MKLLKRVAHLIGANYNRRVLHSEYLSQTFTHHNERTIEYRFALDQLGRFRPKSVLDVGTGTTAWPRLLRDCGYKVSAIDNISDYWPEGMVNRFWHVINEDIVAPTVIPPGDFDAITCISVLEHIEAHSEAVSQMFRLLRVGGILILTCPFNMNTFCENVYLRDDALYGQDAPYKCSSYSKAQLSEWQEFGELSAAEYWRLFSGPVWACGQRTEWVRASSEDAHQLGCFTLIRKQQTT